jgi:hypothetical protein
MVVCISYLERIVLIETHNVITIYVTTNVAVDTLCALINNK